MRRKLAILCACVGLAIASPTAFSVHDDILAFPQVIAKLLVVGNLSDFCASTK